MSGERKTPTSGMSEEYNRRVREAKSVWLSGYLTGKGYITAPPYEEEADLYDAAHLASKNYVVPKGYVYNEMNLPEILRDQPLGFLRICIYIYTISMFFAFLFLGVSAFPLPWLSGKSSNLLDPTDTFEGVHFTPWGQYGGQFPSSSVKDWDCSKAQQIARSVAGSIIVSAVMALLGAVQGTLKLFGNKGHLSSYFLMLLLAFLACAWGMCGNWIAFSWWKGHVCGADFHEFTKLSVGYALSLCGWVLALVSFCLIGIATHFNVGPSLRYIRTFDTAYFIILCISLTFVTVASSRPLFARSFNDDMIKKVRVGFWREEVEMKDHFTMIASRGLYRCDKYRAFIRASITLLLLSTIFLFFATVLSIGAFFKSLHRILSCGFAILAEACLTVSWILGVIIRYTTFCSESTEGSPFSNYPGVPSGVENGKLSFDGYHLREGLVLPIVAWILLLAAIGGNIYIPWPV